MMTMSGGTRTLKILTLTYAGMIFLAIAWGGYVRAYGAGMGCGPDWPLCNGYIIPPDLFTDMRVFLEYFHRIIAFLTGWVALGATIYILARYRHDKPLLLALIAVDTLLLIQITIGMYVVATHLDPFLSATHLAVASATFAASVVLATLSMRR